ncbi:L-lactate dehydrogenase complex protein LldG [Nocardioides sp. J9]|uniref:LutC/YkgG family protein n=1 Tax=unclassified Nocardioides TaxID=2615069 RepID=UPI00048F9ABB|nr:MULTISPECIES: lactate utilization protein C [unclassified Nocardioides]TWG91533.1 L-lactate dehydrogenase complex protein LldG [Nocardioides sp. J9]
MSSRAAILGRVSAALAGADRVPPPRQEYGAPAAVPDVVGLFVERVEDYRAVVEQVAPQELAAAVARALGGTDRVVVPPGLEGAWLSALDGAEVLVDDGDLSPDDLDRCGAVVTAAAVGIATTGTIVLDHRPDQGRRALSLVPDLHVCVVRESQLVGDVPESVTLLRAAVDAGRPSTWISGPSATSDIELERVEGVHGPRTLHVLLVRDGDGLQSPA